MFTSEFNCLESNFVQESWRFCIESWLLIDMVTASTTDSYGSASHGGQMEHLWNQIVVSHSFDYHFEYSRLLFS